VFRSRPLLGVTLRGKIQGSLKEWSRSRPVNTVSTQSASDSGITWSAEVRMSRRIVSMLAALVTVALLLVVGLAAYVLYLTPNPKDPI
jgi:hypothetical protein